MNHRLESKSEWSSLISALKGAAPPLADRCLAVVRKHCMARLAGNRYVRLAERASTASDFLELAAAAEAADDEYLTALESKDGVADSEVLERFSTARALAALLATLSPDARVALLDGAYELSAISTAESEALRADISEVIAHRR